MTRSNNSVQTRELGQLGLGWQIVLLTVCIFVGHKLTNSFGPSLAESLGIEFEYGQQTAFEVFFAAVVAIIGILAYRAVRFILSNRTGEEH
jgi:hypothetical protein